MFPLVNFLNIYQELCKKYFYKYCMILLSYNAGNFRASFAFNFSHCQLCESISVFLISKLCFILRLWFQSYDDTIVYIKGWINKSQFRPFMVPSYLGVMLIWWKCRLKYVPSKLSGMYKTGTLWQTAVDREFNFNINKHKYRVSQNTVPTFFLLYYQLILYILLSGKYFRNTILILYLLSFLGILSVCPDILHDEWKCTK